MKSAKIGLTGGIGCGKSAVAKLFSNLGAFTIDADEIARQLTVPGSHEFDKIIDSFGQKILDGHGNLDRKKLGKVVFGDKNRRRILESILHPAIMQKMNSLCRKSNAIYCIHEIPLLIESGQYREMDRVVVVTSKPELRIKRLLKNRNMSADEIKSIMDAQLSDQERVEKADDVITNDSTVEALEQQVDVLHKTYMAMYVGA